MSYSIRPARVEETLCYGRGEISLITLLVNNTGGSQHHHKAS